MRVGLIAEGPADLAVLSNLVRGVLDIGRDDIVAIRPELTRDETDLHAPGAETFSNWLLVKQECIERDRIDEFLESPVIFEGDDGKKRVVIQIDTAECHLTGFDIPRPDRKSADYATVLLERVRERMAEWLGGNVENIVRAVAVEETDAWLLALYGDKGSAMRLDAKSAWNKLRLKKGLAEGDYGRWSDGLRKRKVRDDARKNNASLDQVVRDLDAAR